MDSRRNCRSFYRIIGATALFVLTGPPALLAGQGNVNSFRIEHQMSAVRLKPGQFGWTELMEAAFNGDSAAVERLLAKGADVNARAQAGTTALMIAAAEGQTTIVFDLLAYGADVNARNQGGNTALMGAAADGNTTIVSKLLSLGADVNLTSETGETALTLAVSRGRTEIVKILLDKGAKIPAGKSGRENLLATAARDHDIAIVQALILHDADLKKVGGPALIAAIMNNNLAMVRTLLDDGVDVNTQSADGTSALVYALDAKNGGITMLLLNRGARVDWPETYGATVLQRAVRTNSGEIVQAILAKGVDVNAPNQMGETALIVAAREDLPSMLELLLAHGARIGARDEKGISALDYADKAGATDVVKELLSRMPAKKAATALVYFKSGDHRCELERWDPVTRHAQTLRSLKVCPSSVYYEDAAKAVIWISGDAIQEVSLQVGAGPAPSVPLPFKKGEEASLYSAKDDRMTPYLPYQVGRLADKRLAVAYGRNPEADDRHLKLIFLAYDGKRWDRIGKEDCHAFSPCAPGPIRSRYSKEWRRESAIWNPMLIKNPFVIKRGGAANLPLPRQALNETTASSWHYLTFSVHGHESILYYYPDEVDGNFGLYSFAISLQTDKEQHPNLITDEECDTAIEYHDLLFQPAFGDTARLVDLETGQTLLTGLKDATWIY